MQCRIGIDLDNTIISYDRLFHSFALKESWIGLNCPPVKSMIRKGLENYSPTPEEAENRWQQLQVWVYGDRIFEAEIFPGFLDFIKQARRKNVFLYIVSHKSEYSNYDPSVNLRNSAAKFLEAHQFFTPCSKGGLGFKKNDLYFEETLDDKVLRIKSLNLTCFIDDLVKVFQHPGFSALTQKWFFEPVKTETTNNFFSFVSWKDIEAFWELTMQVTETCKQDIKFIRPILGSGNNRVSLVELECKSLGVVKSYLSKGSDWFKRLDAEFYNFQALWESGFKKIPQPLHKGSNWAMYSYLDGKPLEKIRNSDIKYLVGILSDLSQLESKLEKFNLPNASASRECLRHYPEAIERRLKKILLGCKRTEWEKEVTEFIHQEFMPLWQYVRSVFQNTIAHEGINLDKPFGRNKLIFSPSDIGFHNIVADKNRRLYLLDFEYSGWDDAAKLAADFFHHVGQNVSWENKWLFLGKLASQKTEDPGFLKRWSLIIDTIGLEWILIILNVTDPQETQRKQYSNPVLQTRFLIDSRLQKARTITYEINQRRVEGEEFVSLPSGAATILKCHLPIN